MKYALHNIPRKRRKFQLQGSRVILKYIVRLMLKDPAALELNLYPSFLGMLSKYFMSNIV